MKSYTLFLSRVGLCLGLLPGGLFGARSAAHRFGFLGPEIFPIERGVANLRVADLNGDGKMDLVCGENTPYSLQEGDCFSIPHGMPFSFKDGSPSLELLEVSMPPKH